MERLAKKTVIRLFLQARRLGQHAQNRAARRHTSDIYSPEAPEMHHRQLTHAGQRLAVGLLTSISPDVAKVNCLACMKCQQLYLHTSSSHWASKAKNTKKKLVKPVKFSPKGIRQAGEVIPIRVNMTVQELADAMKKDVDHVFEVFLYVKNTDRYDQPDSEIDNLDVIKETLKKSGFRFKMEAKEKAPEKVNKDAFKRPPPDPSVLVKRPPVVTIMGHVDHGKTTLLDSLRHSNVVEHEFGGITQHIGAFSVKLPHGETITFLDTPGHAAFSAIRSRGAHVTDLIVLVVAVEDGVMQQTKESIDLAAECNVPVIVAINKIDKDESSLEAAKQSLMQHGVMLEEMGGDVQAIPISALKGTNLDLLQEAILAQAEMLEVRADPTGPVEGVVLESRMDPGRGKLSTALVQRGTLKKGVYLVAGTAWAKVRGMFNDQGKPVQEAGPSMPVEVLGWRQLPSAGDEILQLESEHHVREVIHWREAEQMLKKAEQDQVFIAQKVEEHEREYQQQLQERRERGIRRKLRATGPRQKEEVGGYEGPEVAVVVKGDVDGSVEAILDTLDTYQSDQCRLHVLHYGVGPVSDHDVEMATLFNGVVYAFNVPTTAHAEKLANAAKVVVKRVNVIYRLVEDVKERLKEKLPPKEVEEIQGEANVLQPFTITEGKKKIPVAGCRCVKGALHKKKTFRLLRDGEVLFDGNVTSLKHFKNEVDSIKTDVECGISFADHSVVPQAGDIIVCYETKQEQQEIDWDFGF